MCVRARECSRIHIYFDDDRVTIDTETMGDNDDDDDNIFEHTRAGVAQMIMADVYVLCLSNVEKHYSIWSPLGVSIRKRKRQKYARHFPVELIGTPKLLPVTSHITSASALKR